MCAKNHLLIFSSFLDIWENVEWPRFFLDHTVDVEVIGASTGIGLGWQRRAHSLNFAPKFIQRGLVEDFPNFVFLEEFFDGLKFRDPLPRRRCEQVSNDTKARTPLASIYCGFSCTTNCPKTPQQIEAMLHTVAYVPLLRLVVDLSYKSTTKVAQQVACNNRQVLQQVAQLVVRRIHS